MVKMSFPNGWEGIEEPEIDSEYIRKNKNIQDDSLYFGLLPEKKILRWNGTTLQLYKAITE